MCGELDQCNLSPETPQMLLGWCLQVNRQDRAFTRSACKPSSDGKFYLV